MLSKFQNMLPRLNHNFNGIPSSINEIFNAREIYISDSRITPEYIKYIRPINEPKEKRHKKKFPKNKTKIDLNIFKKRTDQYDFNTFCKKMSELRLLFVDIISLIELCLCLCYYLRLIRIKNDLL